MLREPRFPPTELDQLKRQRATSLEASRTDPQDDRTARAAAATAIRIRRGDPRYAPTLEESIADNNAVTAR